MEKQLITPQECVELDAKYGQDLYFYLTFNKEEQKQDVVKCGLWMFINYVQTYYFEEDKNNILVDIRRKYAENKEILYNDIINGIYKSFFDKFSSYLIGEYQSIERFANAPSWMCYTKPKVIKNRWILYDSEAEFSYCGNIKEKYDNKYVFGYLAHDIDTLYPIQKEEKTYLLCRGNGVKALNVKTKQYYVMFWKETAKDYLNVMYKNNQWHVYCESCENILYSCDKLSDIAEWIKKYDNPYRDNFLDFLKDKKQIKK